MITIAILGKYTEEDIVYAINTIVSQNDVEIELIISVCDAEFAICEAVETLNAHPNNNIQRVLTNIACCCQRKHLEYIRDNMTGDMLLCLWNGTALYDSSSLFSCEKRYEGTFLIAKNVLFGKEAGYCGETPNGLNAEENLDEVMTAGNNGSIILPKEFVNSHAYEEVQVWEKDLVASIKSYIAQKQDERCITVSDVPLLRCYVEKQQDADKIYVKEYFKANISKWQEQLTAQQIKLNYSANQEVEKIVKSAKTDKTAVLADIEKKKEYIIKKSRNSKWDITDSDKALLAYLDQISNKDFSKWEWFKFAHKKSYEKKIKVVFVVVENSLWISCFKSIYDELTNKGNRRKYIVDIVYAPFNHPDVELDENEEYTKWQASGYTVRKCEEYNLDKESPDVMLFCKPYDVCDEKWCVDEIYKIVRKIIYVPYNMTMMRHGEEIKKLTYHLPMHVVAWKILVYNKVYSDLIDKNAYHSRNKLLIGHPKFDVCEADLTREDRELVSRVKHLAGNKKIFLWNTHFAVALEDIEGAGTFLTMGLQFLRDIVDTTEIFLLWRPHPMFLKMLEKQECFEEVQELIKIGTEKKKLYLDLGKTQWASVLVSDVLISDASSVIESYTTTKKPIILTMRENQNTVLDKVVYKACCYEELKNIVQKLDKEGDFLYAAREKYLLENYYLPCKGDSVAVRLEHEIRKSITEISC